jgi:2-haloacid dehalogenase
MLVAMDFSAIRLITFDCYGTLIDWETGMLAQLRPMFPGVPDARLLEEYGEAEVELEAGDYLPYRQVLARSAETMGRRLKVSVSSEASRRFAESLVQWEPFPDTVAALQSLAKKFRLGIISNIDDDLFAATEKKLGVEFSVIVTAQQVRSYKPSPANFEEAVGRSGLKKEEILHAAQSVYHDIVPANALGIRNVWVDRPSARPGSGATRPAVAQPTAKVSSLAELVKLLGA